MKWDKNEIINDLNYIMNMLKDASELDSIILRRDIAALLYVLKIVDKKTYLIYRKEFDKCDLSLGTRYQDFIKESINCIKENKELISDLVLLAADKKFPYPLSYRKALKYKKDFNHEKYLENIVAFFDYYDLNNTYQKLKSSNIHLSIKDRDFARERGSCISVYSLNKSYIIVNYKNKLELTTLPHEIAHAYEFDYLSEFEKHYNWFNSSFSEAFPRFIEYTYCDYNQNSEYKEVLLLNKYLLFDSITANADFYSSIIPYLQDYDFNDLSFKCSETRDYRISKRSIDFFISNFFAIYLYNLYKNDKDKFSKFITKYHLLKGISDKEIWNMVTGSDLITAFKEELNNINEEIYLARRK